MRIDLHCHTIKAKSGDTGRDINASDLAETLSEAQVGIAAITNHNLFDLRKYEECVSAAKSKDIAIWPGIEFDVRGKSNAVGHVIVIADPTYASAFSAVCDSLVGDVAPDDFVLEWDKLAPAFVDSGFDFIVMSHYRPFRGKAYKDKALPYADNEALRKSFPEDTPFFFEPSNLKRAGVMYADGVNCLIGSDVKDWSRYSECSLPELKLEVDTFRQFLLLLRKTPEVLKTIMDRKTAEQVEVTLFDDPSPLVFSVYNDVNIIFGGKGTGKTALLEKIEEHFRARGWTDVSSYYASKNGDTYKQMVTLKPIEADFAKLGIDAESDSFASLKTWTEPAVTSFEKYIEWEEYRAEKKDTENFGFSMATTPSEPDLNDMRTAIADYQDFKENARRFVSDEIIGEFLDDSELTSLRSLVDKACLGARRRARETFKEAFALRLECFTVRKMKGYITARTGNPTKPACTGFSSFAMNCNKARKALSSIAAAFKVEPYEDEVLLGRLREKGDVLQHRKYLINPTQATKVTYLKESVKANPLKAFVTAIGDAAVVEKTPTAELPSKIAEINSNAEAMGVESLKDCLGATSSVSCGEDANYEPSSGEKAMLVLAHALFDDDASIYILDEPEASMGNEFINDVIVDRINRLAKCGKIVVVSTHNANIAVRSLPWLSIYREYDSGKYRTYGGNPFCDELKDLDGKAPSKSWTQVSMSALEGGEDAFAERELVYGKYS